MARQFHLVKNAPLRKPGCSTDYLELVMEMTQILPFKQNYFMK